MTGSDTCAPTAVPTSVPTPWSATPEFTALSALYASTSGASSWYTNQRWMTGDACTNSWYGLTCASGHVTYVGLVENHGLSGTLPTEMGLLTTSTALGLRWNGKIDGTLPTQIGQMSLLKSYFGMEGIGFSGSLPTEVGSFTGLAIFSIYANGFTGALPTQFGQIGDGSTVHTQYLRLYSNEFSSTIPVSYYLYLMF